MKKRLLTSMVTLTSIAVLAACGSSQPKETAKSAAKETTEVTTTEATTQTTTKEATTTSAAKTTTTSAATTTSSAAAKKTTTAATGFSGKNYADTEHIEFAINGKVYKLGETTLQTLIDDGVPFEAEGLNNAGNNVNPNSQSDRFDIVLGDYWKLQVWTSNFTEQGKPAKDLPISDIFYPHKDDQTQSVLTFNFPWDLTLDSLKANAGEPTKFDHYDGGNGFTIDTADYRYESSLYLSEGGYQFEFQKGKLSSVRLIYIPR